MHDEKTSGKPKAVTASGASTDPAVEHVKGTPKDPKEMLKKAGAEAAGEHGVWEKAKAVGRELDRDFGGEYEKREDKAAR